MRTGAGDVSVLISTTEANPVYDAPVDLEFGKLLESVTSVHLGVNVDATAVASNWHIPGTHYLESWGDVRSADGTYSIVQPMILPLYGGWSELDLFSTLLDMGSAELPEGEGAPSEADSPSYQAVLETFKGIGGDEAAWNLALRDGFLAESAFPKLEISGSLGTLELAKLPAPTAGSLEVRFVLDSKIYDGRYVNNGWQQEIPDPVSKITWDNAAVVSVKTFKELGLKKDGQRIKVAVNNREAYFPVLQIPGHADHCITIAVGYGQEQCGRVGRGTGFNAYGIRTAATSYIASGATVEVLGKNLEFDAADGVANAAPDEDGIVRIRKYEELALTQEHSSMEGRAIVRDGNLTEFEKDPDFAKTRGMDSHVPENLSLYKPEMRDGTEFNDLDKNHQWAMTIDLNTCYGCSACQLACQAENNIPIVGKEQVLIGREMAWIRMDRYFADTSHGHHGDEVSETGSDDAYDLGEVRGVEVLDEDKIEMLSQPVSCQQCESAPCETVCPVNATVHSDDGLNAMAYNRCIGTRYCANNCPYKARRFNFFDYNKRPLDELYWGPLSSRSGVPDSMQLQKNPNVTVRMRGVMEKCTYCVQRIQDAKIAAKSKARNSSDVKVPVNGVKAACQQSCPTNSISFGNLRSAGDTVNAYKASPRNYDLLKYIGTRPRTSYLARVRNPNKNMPDWEEVGQVTKHMH
ncbi:MAG: 4Fe-4S dicluster domain-containing protein [Verrucomicrobiota bacterium]